MTSGGLWLAGAQFPQGPERVTTMDGEGKEGRKGAVMKSDRRGAEADIEAETS